MGRVCHLTNKIYREMLCITTDERMRYITMGTGGIDNLQDSSAFSWPPQYRIILSRNLLAWILEEGRISSSFTDFITTPEFSGPLYISADIFHTHITEYFLWALSISTLNIFLIVILIDTLRYGIGSFGNTFPMLFQLKWFLINFEQFLLTSSYMFTCTLQNWHLIRWRLLSSGFRSVLVNATDKTPQTKNPICV